MDHQWHCVCDFVMCDRSMAQADSDELGHSARRLGQLPDICHISYSFGKRLSSLRCITTADLCGHRLSCRTYDDSHWSMYVSGVNCAVSLVPETIRGTTGREESP